MYMNTIFMLSNMLIIRNRCNKTYKKNLHFSENIFQNLEVERFYLYICTRYEQVNESLAKVNACFFLKIRSRIRGMKHIDACRARQVVFRFVIRLSLT